MGPLRFSTDDDLLRMEPTLDDIYPRFDRSGAKRLHDWDIQHELAMEWLERALRTKRATPEPVELGRLGLRSREHIKRAVAAAALHYLFIAADPQGDPTGWYFRKANHYERMASDIVDAEAVALDYDADNDGEITTSEQQRPFPAVVLRG